MSEKFYVLGIETSCDETAAAVVDSAGTVLSNIVFSQIDMHNKFGGIVPELASRDHALKIRSVVDQALLASRLTADDITHVGVTSGPGLLGCLLVGLSFAKSFAMAKNIPLIQVDHVRAHMMSAFIKDAPEFPFVGLVVSGGHTSIYLVKSVTDIKVISSTVDDAAGEVFDKLARFLGLGYPGGKVLSELAQKAQTARANNNAGATPVKFPKPTIKGRENDFSFSGLKTSAINYFGSIKENNVDITKDAGALNALAAFQETICDVLVEKLIAAAKENKVTDVVIGGGVASNYRLRELFVERAKQNKLNPILIPVEYCTDNAAMIANYARLLCDGAKNYKSEMNSIKAYSTTRR